MKAQYITKDIDKANTLLKLGWHVADHKLAVASGGMTGQGLSNSGVEYVADKMRIEARTFILELEDAIKCVGLGSDYHNDECCAYTRFTSQKQV